MKFEKKVVIGSQTRVEQIQEEVEKRVEGEEIVEEETEEKPRRTYNFKERNKLENPAYTRFDFRDLETTTSINPETEIQNSEAQSQISEFLNQL